MFFFPFSDDNPTQNKPYVTYFLIGVCCFIFLWQFTLPPQLFESAVYNFGVVPASLLGSKEGYLPATTTIFTSMFMHGGWMHLIGNMLFLWIFGNAVCAKIGNVRYLPIYLGLGIFAGLTHMIFQGGPVIGASGAINGVVGMFLVFFPENSITCFWIFFGILISVRIFRNRFIINWLNMCGCFDSATEKVFPALTYFESSVSSETVLEFSA